MASLVSRPNNHFWIQFSHNGKRQTIRLGQISRTDATEIKVNIERMVQATKHGAPIDPGTSRWYYSRPKQLKEKLARTGLAELGYQAGNIRELINFCEAFYGESADRTKSFHGQVHDCLTRYFGGDTQLSGITAADAKAFRKWLESSGRKPLDKHDKPGRLAPATVSRRCKHVKQMFGLAVDKRWIDSNPFMNLRNWVSSNPERARFIPRELSEKILEELPDVEIRLIFALARYGGLRIPSEAQDLTWQAFNWSTREFTVFSRKNQRFSGKRRRTLPIFADLAPYVDAALDAAPDKATWSCPYLRENTVNAVKSKIKKAMRRLNIDPWPKLFQNLRVTRANEINAAFGAKCEEMWLGHCERVAHDNYLMVSSSDVKRAVEMGIEQREAKSEASDARSPHGEAKGEAL